MLNIGFILSNVSLGWSEAFLLYKNGFMRWEDFIEIAHDRLNNGSDNSLEIDLIVIGTSNVWQTLEIVEELAEGKEASADEIREKWLFLNLLWAYENRSDSDPLYEDALSEVEGIADDFGLPDTIRSFVRYAPPDPEDEYQPSCHSLKENRERMMSKWAQYLEETRKHFNRSTPYCQM